MEELEETEILQNNTYILNSQTSQKTILALAMIFLYIDNKTLSEIVVTNLT